jgi:hypothetical protein
VNVANVLQKWISFVERNLMTGWLRPMDIVTCIWKLKRLPGGVWLGLVMIITTLLSVSADLTVTAFVVPVLASGECLFTYGLVMNWQTQEVFSSPPPNGYPALIASNVQIYSANSNCSVGIYTKVPWSGDPAFCGRDIDILGRWECEDQNKDTFFNPNVTADSITGDLMLANLQYPNTSYWNYFTPEGETTHLAICKLPLALRCSFTKSSDFTLISFKHNEWENADCTAFLGSSSVGSDDLGAPFNVLVSIDLNASVSDIKTMKTFLCATNSNSTNGQTAINSILSQMESFTALSDWAAGLEGILYEGDGTGASDYSQSNLEQYLNTMTMVQGGSNSVLNPPTDNLVYGCIVNKTKIATGIYFLVLFLAFIFVITLLYWILLLLVISTHAVVRLAKRKSGLRNIKPVPDSVISWMLQAARENVQGSNANAEGAPMKEQDLRDWIFTVIDSTQGVARIGRANESVTNVTTVIEETGQKV